MGAQAMAKHTTIGPRIKGLLRKGPMAPLVYRPLRHLKRTRAFPNHLFWRLAYKIRWSSPVWSRVLNRRARALYQASQPDLSHMQEQAVQDLRENGISVLHVSDLFSEEFVTECFAEADKALQEPDTQNRIEESRVAIGSEDARTRAKYYLTEFWDPPVIDLENRLLRVVLGDQVTGIVSGYLGGFLTPAWCLHQAVPRAARACRFSFTDRSSQRDWYYVRVRQQNDQWAWTSPIWVDG